MRLLVMALVLAAAVFIWWSPSSGAVPPTPPASAVVLDFDTYPAGDWSLWSNGGSSNVSGGVLTIDSPSAYHEFILWHPDGLWHQEVSNSRGWVIEARLQVDPTTAPQCDGGRGAVQIWANDHTNLVIVGFSTDKICIAYPDLVQFPMDTTDGYHVYRIESRLDNVKVYVDGDLVIDHTLSWTGGGSDILMFGDGVGGKTSLSYWDYFWYDVTPDVTDECGGSPPGECVDVTGCTVEEGLASTGAALAAIIASSPGTPLADKVEDALAGVRSAEDELGKTPPDPEAAAGDIEGAVGDLEAAVDDGLLDPTEGTQLMNCLAGVARLLATDALAEAFATGGDPSVLAEATQYLVDGDELRAAQAFKDAVNKYKDALAKARSAP